MLRGPVCARPRRTRPPEQPPRQHAQQPRTPMPAARAGQGDGGEVERRAREDALSEANRARRDADATRAELTRAQADAAKAGGATRLARTRASRPSARLAPKPRPRGPRSPALQASAKLADEAARTKSQRRRRAHEGPSQSLACQRGSSTCRGGCGKGGAAPKAQASAEVCRRGSHARKPATTSRAWRQEPNSHRNREGPRRRRCSESSAREKSQADAAKAQVDAAPAAPGPPTSSRVRRTSSPARRPPTRSRG